MFMMDDLSVFQYSCSQLLSNYPTYNSIAYPKVKESPEAFMIKGVEKVLDIHLQYPYTSDAHPAPCIRFIAQITLLPRNTRFRLVAAICRARLVTC